MTLSFNEFLQMKNTLFQTANFQPKKPIVAHAQCPPNYLRKYVFQYEISKMVSFGLLNINGIPKMISNYLLELCAL